MHRCQHDTRLSLQRRHVESDKTRVATSHKWGGWFSRKYGTKGLVHYEIFGDVIEIQHSGVHRRQMSAGMMQIYGPRAGDLVGK